MYIIVPGHAPWPGLVLLRFVQPVVDPDALVRPELVPVPDLPVVHLVVRGAVQYGWHVGDRHSGFVTLTRVVVVVVVVV